MLPFAKLLLSRGGINIPLLESELDYVTFFVQWDPSTLKVNRGLKSVCTWGLAFPLSVFQNLEIDQFEHDGFANSQTPVQPKHILHSLHLVFFSH